MVPGFQDHIASSQSAIGNDDSRVALAGPWDFSDGSGRRTKICGQPYTNVKCIDPVQWCQNCRQCHWSDSYGLFEDCALWYPCGVCVGTQGW